ncbi:MAG: Uma2 family endonuclease, partial [Vicinamibacteria bacterium]
MSTQIVASPELLAQLPADSTLTLRNVPWEDYEALLEVVGEAPGLGVIYDQGTLQIETLSPEHESYSKLIERLVDRLSARLHIKMLFFGSSTMKRKDLSRGAEPDACFYVKTAAAIGRRVRLDFASDPPPDIAVEIDITRDSLSKFPLYAALGVPELWRYDGTVLTMYHLKQSEYAPVSSSLALPVLDARTLTSFLN